MRYFRTRGALAGASALALVGATAVPLSQAFAEPQQAGSTPSSQQSTPSELEQKPSIQKTEGTLDPLAEKNTIKVQGTGLDKTLTDGYYAEMWEIDAQGQPVGENIAEASDQLTLGQRGQFDATLTVRGSRVDPQKHYAVFIVDHTGRGGHMGVHATAPVNIKPTDPTKLRPRFETSPETLYTHRQDNEVTIRGKYYYPPNSDASVAISLREKHEDGGPGDEVATGTVAASELKDGTFTYKLHVPGEKIKDKTYYTLAVAMDGGTKEQGAIKELYGHGGSFAVITDGTVSRSSQHNQVKVAGGGFKNVQQGTAMHLRLREYNIDAQKPAGDALAEKQVTVNPPNGSFETDFAVPADKLQAGKKYVIEASIDDQEQSEVTEYITVNP